KPSDDKVLGIAAVVKNDKYTDILEASLGSITIDNGTAQPPGIAAMPTPHIPELADLGKGDYSYASDNIPQKEYAQAEPVTQKPAAEEPVTNQTPVALPPATLNAGKGSLNLKKLNSFSDFVGRNEALQGNGSPDSQLRLEIEAPGKTIISLILRETVSQKVIWDTTNGNSAWLIAVTKKNKPVNNTDGSLGYKLGAGKEKLDLWLQDNHTIAAGKKELELVLGFDNNESLILPLER
ncbi:MAG: hypothetical protein KKE61_01005, partial [Proteobacteria bacterium]|nr:hypothetical protein [Pseudomonadota bacterium]